MVRHWMMGFSIGAIGIRVGAFLHSLLLLNRSRSAMTEPNTDLIISYLLKPTDRQCFPASIVSRDYIQHRQRNWNPIFWGEKIRIVARILVGDRLKECPFSANYSDSMHALLGSRPKVGKHYYLTSHGCAPLTSERR